MKNIKPLIIVCLLLTSFGCQKFSTVKIQQQEKQLTFDLSELASGINNPGYIINDIAVSKSTCPAESCVLWEMVRKQDLFNRYDIALSKPLVSYGSINANMNTTIKAKPLEKGDYTLSASIVITENNKLVKNHNVLQNFKLDMNQH